MERAFDVSDALRATARRGAAVGRPASSSPSPGRVGTGRGVSLQMGEDRPLGDLVAFLDHDLVDPDARPGADGDQAVRGTSRARATAEDRGSVEAGLLLGAPCPADRPSCARAESNGARPGSRRAGPRP